MQAPELRWNTDALRRRLAASWPGIAAEVVASTGSTNSDLLERARSGAPVAPALRIAELQTAGRGRQGRSWHAERGASLTFSLAVPLERSSLAGLSLAVGAVLADALDPTGSRMALKWPNDLFLLEASGSARKLGGVLIETVPLGRSRLVVIGIGLNVRRLSTGEDRPAAMAALDEIDPGAAAPAVLEAIATPLGTALRRFEQSGFPAFQRRFDARDLLAGHAVTTTRAGAAEGLAEGVDADGCLQLRLANGMRVGISSGEVSVRLDRTASPC